MDKILSNDVLARLANVTYEVADATAMLGRDLQDAVFPTQEPLTTIDQARVANTLSKAGNNVLELLKPLAKQQLIDELQQNKQDIIGDHLYRNGIVRIYESRSYTWENKHDIEDEDLTLRNEMFARIKLLQAEIDQLKPKMKGLDEALAIKYPDSKAIKRKLVMQFL